MWSEYCAMPDALFDHRINKVNSFPKSYVFHLTGREDARNILQNGFRPKNTGKQERRTVFATDSKEREYTAASR
jgi:tRNA (Thr-GGU) A37 N-methylase